MDTDWIFFCFVDASFKEEELSMGYAFLLYSVDDELFMHIVAGWSWASSTIHAEAEYLLFASKWLSTNLPPSITIPTECKKCADIVKNGDLKAPSQANTITKSMWSWRISHNHMFNISIGKITQRRILWKGSKNSNPTTYVNESTYPPSFVTFLVSKRLWSCPFDVKRKT